MAAIKKFDKVGMTLMGFKPRTYLKAYHNVKHATFVYPDDKKVAGSSQCADALIKEMIFKERIAIVRVQARENTQMKFCALLPQDESYNEETGIQTPPGFQCIVLPFAEDIRDLDNILAAAGFGQREEREMQPASETLPKLAEKERNAAKLMIKNFSIDFDSRNFENPTIQKFYSGLQALALNEDEPEEVEDYLEPDYEELERRGPVLQKFKDAFFGGYDSDSELTKKPAGRGRAPAKGTTKREPVVRKRPAKKEEIIAEKPEEDLENVEEHK